MSFIITMYVREGIVMASDSRLTLNSEQPREKQVVNIAVGLSDSNYKTFLAPNRVGISTYGLAEIKGSPIGGFIESFIQEQLTGTNIEIHQIAQKLLEYFRRGESAPATQFHVAGYKEDQDSKDQQVWHVDVAQNITRRLNPPGTQGAWWGGEADIVTRMVNPVGTLDKDGNLAERLPYFQIPWQFFTLQDAIDFCVFAVRSTIDAIRFQPRPKTVGGPIDVLVIKPDKAFWVQRKELHG